MTIRRHAQLPPIVPTPLSNHVFEIVVPVARTNLVSNPSFETGTTSWTAIGAGTAIARSTTRQYSGAYSLAVTPDNLATSGVRFDVWNEAPIGTLFAYSIWIYAPANLSYKLSIEDTAAVELASVTALSIGRWQRLVGYYLSTSTTSRRLVVRKNNSANLATFYIDAAQVEVIQPGEIVSTYLDGDMQGLVPNQSPPAFYWSGTPHASTSSRSGLTRAGGMVFRFKDFNFFLSAIIGLELAGVVNVSTEYARIDGAFDDYTRKPSRQFTLVGQFQGANYPQLRADRGTLASYFDRDLVGLDQQLVLRHHLEDPCGTILSDVALLPCKYVSGLSGNDASYYGEATPITFTQYLPVIQAEGEAGDALGVQAIIGSANGIIKRSPTGTWSGIDTGDDSGIIQAVKVGPNGDLYVGGSFTGMSGVANTARIAKSVGGSSVWTAMGTGAAGTTVKAIAFDSSGNLYAAGDTTGFGGVANTAGLGKWNGAAWSSITPAGSANDIIDALAFDAAGNLYASGRFTSINAVAANRIAKMTPAGTWSALGTGLNDEGNALAIDKAGNVIVGGNFTTANGVTCTRIAKWDGSTFAPLAGGFDATVLELAFAPNGDLYAGGDFALSGSTAVSKIARWNGVQWSPVGTGASGGGVYALTFVPASGLLYVGGGFTSIGGVTTPDSFAVWNGSTYVYPDADLPGAGIVYDMVLGRDGTLFVGFSTRGSATASIPTTISNLGTARTYPVITITGPSSGTARIYSIVNNTTNRGIYTTLTMVPGETVTMNFRPDNLSFVSDYQGNIAGTILPGSQEADFFLNPGSNSISFFSAGSSVTAVIRRHPAFATLDSVP